MVHNSWSPSLEWTTNLAQIRTLLVVGTKTDNALCPRLDTFKRLLSEVDWTDFDIPKTRPDIMGDFVKPWRRKIGIMTLVMALVIATAWVRSLLIGDQFTWPTSKHIYHAVASVKGVFSWDTADYKLEEFEFPSRTIWSHPRGRIDLPLTKINWSFYGISYSEHQWNDHFETLFLIPYLSIVFPLTLISLWLLLSTPRKSTQGKIGERIPEEVA